MKLIKLTQGKFAQVDDEDYGWLMKWKWHARQKSNTVYAARVAKKEDASNGFKVKSTIQMHRIILGVKDTNLLCDHKDRNGLNNQRNNLRIATYFQNSCNRSKRKNSISKYRGVSICKCPTKTYWVAEISNKCKSIRIGYFPFTPEGEIEAAKAYDKKAIELQGEFANINFYKHE